MCDKLMTVPNVKTAMESDEVGVIDALRLAFAAPIHNLGKGKVAV
jgi:hypothetical protein